MPGPFYNLTTRLRLRALKGNSEAKDIDAGFLALAEDVDAALALSPLLREIITLSQEGETGKLYIVNATGITLTLPTPTANRIIGVNAAPTHSCKVKASSGKIYGDFVEGATELNLASNQHILLVADGTNWYIVAGTVAESYSGAWTALTLGPKIEGTPKARLEGFGSIVRLRGLIVVKNAESVVTNGVVFTLPTGMQPAENANISTTCKQAENTVRVLNVAAGVATLSGIGSMVEKTQYQLDGITLPMS